MPKLRRRNVQDAQDEQTHAAMKTATPKAEESSYLRYAWTILMACVVASAAFGYYQSPVNVEEVRLPNEFDLEKHLRNDRDILARGERILSGFVGPESMEIDKKGNVYTGLLDGRIVKIHPSATGEIGEGLIETLKRGAVHGVVPIDGHYGARPLGIRLHNGYLYVVDAYYGLYSLNLKTKETKILVKPDDVEPSMKFPNDLDITSDGEYIYFTDTSYRWNLDNLYYDILEGSCTGRFFRYSMKTGDVKLLAGELCFPNGVQLLNNEKIALVSETTRFRVLYIDTKSGKAHNYVVFPGCPDNIRKSGKGGYWVAIPIARTKLFNFMMSRSSLRKVVAGLLPISWIRALSDTRVGMAVKINEDGDIIDIVHDRNGKVSSTVSEVLEMENGLILAGSYKEPYMVKARQ